MNFCESFEGWFPSLGRGPGPVIRFHQKAMASGGNNPQTNAGFGQCVIQLCLLLGHFVELEELRASIAKAMSTVHEKGPDELSSKNMPV